MVESNKYGNEIKFKLMGEVRLKKVVTYTETYISCGL
jgi:hypothetical protein